MQTVSSAKMHTDLGAVMCKLAQMDDQQAATKALVDEMLRVTDLDATNLARQAKVAPSTLTRFLNSPVKHSLSLRTLAKLSRASGVPIPGGWATSEKSTIAVVGYVGAGYRMYPIDDTPLGGGLEQVAAPPGADDDLVAVIVRGDSMIPAFWEGDILFYTLQAGFDRESCLYQECVVKVVDGSIYVKVVRPGRSSNTFDLESFNAVPIRDVEIEWAAPVLHINRMRRKPIAAMRTLTVRAKSKKP